MKSRCEEMSQMKAVLMSWSGGKDSCLALYEVQRSAEYQVAALLTTVTRDFDRISMHGVRRVLLEEQASRVGLPLSQVLIRSGATNDEYEAQMSEGLRPYRTDGIESIVFGDLFLEDIRAYREQFLDNHRMRGIYPLWQRNTSELIRQFIALGFRAIVSCVDSTVLDESFAGRIIDHDFISSLPPQVDPCGENGEFHTFVFDGPNFSHPISLAAGDKVLRDGFWFCDLLPQ
jgi:uncharacterized protein (TIGR00290 family)